MNERIPSEQRAPKQEKEYGVMNLVTNEEGVVGALVNIEGEDWLEEQKTWSEGSIEAAKKSVASGKSGVIRGKRGWNRYSVQDDGTVGFVERHSKGSDYTELAQQIGFKIERM